MFYSQILNPVLANIAKGKDNNAFCIDDKFYTYGQFGETIANIRSLITERTINNKHVGLVTNNDLETYASIFALWLEGLCYVPLHIKQTIDRCEDIIEQVGINTILDSSKKTRYNATLVVNTKAAAATPSNLIPLEGVDENSLAYILFTSGSTGKPKGVSLSRNGLFLGNWHSSDIRRQVPSVFRFDI